MQGFSLVLSSLKVSIEFQNNILRFSRFLAYASLHTSDPISFHRKAAGPDSPVTASESTRLNQQNMKMEFLNKSHGSPSDTALTNHQRKRVA